jgi:integrase
MPQKLSEDLIKGLKPKVNGNRYVVTDTEISGLVVAVYPSGSKIYQFRFRSPEDGRQATISLGNYKDIKLSAARKAAKNFGGNVAIGIDPRKEQQEKKQEKTAEANNDKLKLFYYVEHYYKAYAEETSETHAEMIQTIQREFVDYKNKPINLIDKSDIDQWRRKRKSDITFPTMQRHFTYLKACINSAVKHYELIGSFKLQNYRMERKRGEKVNPPKLRYLTKVEEPVLLETLKKRDQGLREARARTIAHRNVRNEKNRKLELLGPNDMPDHVTPIIIIAYKTGFDFGDIASFDWDEHIDFDNNQICKVRNKTSHKQNNPQPTVVPMPTSVKKLLKQWGKQHGTKGLVFKNTDTGDQLTSIKTAFNKIKKDAGITNFRFKDFRHTFGCWQAMAGTNLLIIRDLMGHKDIKTTQIYARFSPEAKKEAAADVFD